MVGAATGPGGRTRRRPRSSLRPTPCRTGLTAIALLAGGLAGAACSYNDVGLSPAQEPTGPTDGSAGVRDAASGPDRVAAPDVAPDPPGGCSAGQTGACYTGAAETRGVGACREGTRVCQPGGTWGPCTGEGKPGPERCDGADEDCDGVVDDGCPVDSAPVFTDGPRVSSPTFGSATLDQNIAVTHRCPAGQAAIAITGNFGYALDSLGVICGVLRVREDRAAMPFRYFLEVEPGQRFEPVGGTSGGLNDVTRCPPGFVIGAVAGWPSRPTGSCPPAYCAAGRAPSCASNFGLEILCTRFELAGTPGDFRLAPSQAAPFRAAARVEIDLAGVGFPNAKAEYLCPRGQVVVDAYGSVGPWPYDCSKTAVNGLRVSCTEPTVRLR